MEKIPNQVMKFMKYNHLPEHLQEVSKKFHDLAEWCDTNIEHGPELNWALRKLLEAKDSAVRAKL